MSKQSEKTAEHQCELRVLGTQCSLPFGHTGPCVAVSDVVPLKQPSAAQAEIPARPEARHINQFQPALSSFYYVLYTEFAQYADEVERQLRQMQASGRGALRFAALETKSRIHWSERSKELETQRNRCIEQANEVYSKLAVTTDALRKLQKKWSYRGPGAASVSADEQRYARNQCANELKAELDAILAPHRQVQKADTP